MAERQVMTRKRNGKGQFMKEKPTKEIALTQAYVLDQEFDEDHTVLSILRDKLFRRAIESGVEMSMPPDIGHEALAAVPHLPEAIEILDWARDGETPLHKALAAWREQLDEERVA
jgi:stalled ribosome alternative rescue factor ArfA